MKKLIFTLLFGLIACAIGGCSVFGKSDVKEANYKLLKKEGPYEVRLYQPVTVARTLVTEADFKQAGSIGFRRLADYIFGRKSKANIPMTAPVFMNQPDQKQWVMEFVLPEKYTPENAPKPFDKSVQIVRVPERKLAVITFNGSFNIKNFKEHEVQLMQWLKQSNYQALSKPFIAGYNPPWTLPWFRRNEVLVEIK